MFFAPILIGFGFDTHMGASCTVVGIIEIEFIAILITGPPFLEGSYIHLEPPYWLIVA
jgi:hypothetical protein